MVWPAWLWLGDLRMSSGRVPDLVPMNDGCALWTQASGSGRPVVLCHGGPGLWTT
jgi:hypothetical protein